MFNKLFKNRFYLLLGVSLLVLPITASASCALSSKTCISTDNGVCTEYKLSYACTTSTETCSSYSTTTTGDCSNNTADTQNQTGQTANPATFDSAMKDLALLNAIKKDLTGLNPIRIFGGKYYNCTIPMLNGVGLTQNCCITSLKPSNHGIFTGCSTEAVKLAGYRRSGTAYQISDTCSGGLSLFGSCLLCAEKQQDYCVFPNKLSEIIQIKGREQLAQMAAAGYGGAQSGSAQNFTYYDGGTTNTSGNWLAFPAVNNNQVWVWQWPGQCNSTSASSSIQCPYQPKVYVAYCNKSDCVTPTGSPMSTSATGDDMVSVNPAKNISTAISKYVVLTGDCTTAPGSDEANACSYTESAYPGTDGGASGDAVLRATLTFPLYVYTISSSNDGYITSSEAANAEFWGQSLPMSDQGGPLPSTVNVKYSTGDVEQAGVTEANAQYTVALPTQIKMTSNYTITGNSEGSITVFGGCSTNDNLCHYTFEIPAHVHAKPWYTSSHGGPCDVKPHKSTINCSGFTLEEFEELNLAKMHLGKILLDMAPKEPSESSEQTTASSEASSQADNPESPVAAAQS